MKLLLVGPYPPPHGGVSVHVAEMHRDARARGIPCRVLNTDRKAPPNPEFIQVQRHTSFVFNLMSHAWHGWTIHVHTNGHNMKSWLVALAGGLAGRLGPGSYLTLHSGILPEYLDSRPQRRWLAVITCRCFENITCVSSRLLQSLKSLGVPENRIQVVPAFQGITRESARWELPPPLERWLENHQPVFTATAADRAEYGVELLIEALQRVASRYPQAGCILMGVGQEANGICKLIEDRNLTRSVLLLGDIPHGECMHLISRSDAFVRPTFIDGDSISVREALALNVPVIASDVVTRPEGTVLFETGSSEDLVRRIECVLRGS